MKNPASFRFANNTSVRFRLESFALPVALNNPKKNIIYTAKVASLKGTKTKLLPPEPPRENYGYDHAVVWRNTVFASNHRGIFVGDKLDQQFESVNQLIIPQKLAIAHTRLFAIGLYRDRLYYSVLLNTDWTAETLLEKDIYIPKEFGLCLDIRPWQSMLLVVCENGLLAVTRNMKWKHLSEDSDLFVKDLQETTTPVWQSDWFSLGYATDTQTLREVFLKTNVPVMLTVESNRTKKTVVLKASDAVQKIRTNLRGDQFRIAILVSGENFVVSNLSAVIQYGKKGNR